MSCTIALETSSRSPGIALEVQGQRFEKQLDPNAAHAKALLPELDRLMKQAGVSPREISLVIVGVGPGSYTGLRVGIATAKTLSIAAKAPILGICSLSVIAFSCSEDGVIAVSNNAYGGQRYLGIYRKQGNQIQELTGPQLLLPEEIQKAIPENAKRLEDIVPNPSALLELGLQKFQQEGGSKLESVQPLYLRPSRAEIQFAEKKNPS